MIREAIKLQLLAACWSRRRQLIPCDYVRDRSTIWRLVNRTGLHNALFLSDSNVTGESRANECLALWRGRKRKGSGIFVHYVLQWTLSRNKFHLSYNSKWHVINNKRNFRGKYILWKLENASSFKIQLHRYYSIVCSCIYLDAATVAEMKRAYEAGKK